MIEVSVIVPVFNEEKYIDQCIHSLIGQTFPQDKMEWIIVDGNSTDKTVEIIRHYEGRYPIKLLSNPRRKTPISLNMGIRESVGKYIVRFDAHAGFPEDYITTCIEELESTGADNVGGFVETKAEGFTGEAIAHMLSSKFGVGGSSFRTGESSGYVDTVPFGAFRREVFDTVGLFNEALTRSEDNDINARIREYGGKVYLSRRIRSIYYCRDSVPAVLKMALQNGNALFRTLRENPRAMSVRHFIPFVFFASVILLPLAGAFLWKPIWWIFAAEIGVYSLLDILFSFFKRTGKYGIILCWLYPLFHFFYGAGSFLGILGIGLY